MVYLFRWVWSETQVTFATGHAFNTMALGEKSLYIFLLDRWQHHAFFALGPVDGGSYFLVGGELQRVDDTQYLIKVATGGSGVQDRELELLVRTDNEHCTTCHGHARRVLLDRIQHTKLHREVTFRVSDDGIREVSTATTVCLEIWDPFLVGSCCIARQCNHFDIALGEFRMDRRQQAQLRGADWGEIIRMGAEHTPRISQPLIEFDWSLGTVLFEVRKSIS